MKTLFIDPVFSTWVNCDKKRANHTFFQKFKELKGHLFFSDFFLFSQFLPIEIIVFDEIFKSPWKISTS